TYTQLLEVTSESLEGVHYLFVRKSTSIKRGDVVAIQGHKPQYLEGKYLFTKRVIGLPGDQIIKTKKGLAIKAKNGSFTIIYPLLDKTKEGQTLTPLPLQSVPAGYLFVIGDHLRSFDSRYEEFGLVPMVKVWGKAVAKW
ncbi:MAG: signal peptidase I, partial [Alphaproteobacteria bacterium]|nr:signal peptidase I [Alphaproteobacteria bacterium]